MMRRFVPTRQLGAGLHSPAAAIAIVCAVLASAGLAGCMAGPDYTRPSIALPAGFKEDPHWRPAAQGADTGNRADASRADAAGAASTTGAVSAAGMSSAGDAAWWQRWQDPVLDRLEEQAMTANPSLAIAGANYTRARALASQARAALYPSVTASFDPKRSRVADYQNTRERFIYYNETDVHAGLDVRWEADLWGKARREVEAAEASGQAQAAMREAVRLSVSTALAEDYLLVREADRQQAILREEQLAYARVVSMTQGAQRKGLATADDVLRAQNAVSEAQATMAREENARAQAEHAIASLLGMAPAALSIPPDAGYRIALPDVDPVLPSALLERRPDIVAAERQVAAANARIGVAKAAYYPDLLLGAGVGGESTVLAGLLSAPVRIWSLGPSLALTLFDAGRNSARVHAAQADYDAVAAQYRATVIGALQEVEDALARRTEGDEVVSQLKQQWQRSLRLVNDERRQKRAGLASEQNLIETEITANTAERRWQAGVTTAALNRVALVKSIGGNWSAGPPGAGRSD